MAKVINQVWVSATKCVMIDKRNPKYNPDIITQYAADLLRNARALFVLGCIISVFIIAAGVVTDIFYIETHVATIIATINALIIFGIFKYASFLIKLKAQLTLCVLQTEINSRTENL